MLWSVARSDRFAANTSCTSDCPACAGSVGLAPRSVSAAVAKRPASNASWVSGAAEIVSRKLATSVYATQGRISV